MKAESGQDSYLRGGYRYGGDGYSGGADNCECDGGSDGEGGWGYGEGSEAGSGTSEAISEYSFTAWTLSPGAGGKYFYSGYSSYFGGGGGGVMVSRPGPEASHYQGQFS